MATAPANPRSPCQLTRSAPVDGFTLAYERSGSGPPVVLLHGWPGDRSDYRAVAPLLADALEMIVPDLRGFGESDKHAVDPRKGYSAAAQARSVVALIDELALGAVVLGGYDIGSRIAQTVARIAPSRVRALVLAPPLPGVGDRVLDADAQREFWYQAFHQLRLAEQLVDGDPAAVRAYLRHFWEHWSGPGFELADADLDRLIDRYSPAGAFTRRSAGIARDPEPWPAASPRRCRPVRSASPSRRGCSGPITTPCSHRSGRTASTRSSPTSHSPACRPPGTSRHSRPHRRSRTRSARPSPRCVCRPASAVTRVVKRANVS
jgi:pimeloyl-ACP methyl ester carboxylesterase